MKLRAVVLVTCFALVQAGSAAAQGTIADGQTTELDGALTQVALELEELEELVVVGSRARPRTVTRSPVPVDVIQTGELLGQGGSDMADLIRNVVPSYNVNIQPISDAASIVRPANLRNLAPDHTLVLVNGKRRHRAAIIGWLGNGIAEGSQGPDLSIIPAVAVQQVEVLRDGASAQYGSDAIAGVMKLPAQECQVGWLLGDPKWPVPEIPTAGTSKPAACPERRATGSAAAPCRTL